MRTTEKKFDPLKIYDEYDTATVITSKPATMSKEIKQEDFEALIKSIEETGKKCQINCQWEDIEKKIFSSIGELFNGVKQSLCSFDKVKSFGIVGVEFVLDGNLRPVLLGIDRVPTFANSKQFTEVVAAVLCNGSDNKESTEGQFVQIFSS